MRTRYPLAWEVNFDGLVGLTHNYGGLSYGNKASFDNLSRMYVHLLSIPTKQ